MTATVHALYRCAVCGTRSAIALKRSDGTRDFLCRDHLPDGARKLLDGLVGDGWEPPGKR